MLSRTEGCQISVTSAPVISSVLEVVERAGLVGQVWQQSWLAKVEELREGKEQRGWLQAWLLMMMGLNGVGDRTEQSLLPGRQQLWRCSWEFWSQIFSYGGVIFDEYFDIIFFYFCNIINPQTIKNRVATFLSIHNFENPKYLLRTTSNRKWEPPRCLSTPPTSCHSVTESHCPQCHSVTVSKCHGVTMSQYQSVTESQCCSVTVSWSHSLTVSQCLLLRVMLKFSTEISLCKWQEKYKRRLFWGKHRY